MDEFNSRYVDNGIMDYLLKEREAGRIRNLGFSFHGKQEVFDDVMLMRVTSMQSCRNVASLLSSWNPC